MKYVGLRIFTKTLRKLLSLEIKKALNQIVDLELFTILPKID